MVYLVLQVVDGKTPDAFGIIELIRSGTVVEAYSLLACRSML